MEKKIEVPCFYCRKIVVKSLREYKHQLKNNPNYKPYCNINCYAGAKNKKIKLQCDNCGVGIEKSSKDYNKAEKHFCSHSCRALIVNKIREVPKKEVKCVGCENIICVSYISKKDTRCDSCRIKYSTEYNSQHILHICKKCGIEIFATKAQKYCDLCRNQISIENGKKSGVIGGKASAAKQVRRSKNEIYFAELCLAHFETVSTNDGYFQSPTGNWDADIIIHEHKLAVLWNGVWHYKQITKTHKLKQVQSRDKIKISVINKNGYIPYIIKDMGKEDKKFVEEQFQILLSYLKL